MLKNTQVITKSTQHFLEYKIYSSFRECFQIYSSFLYTFEIYSSYKEVVAVPWGVASEAFAPRFFW